MFFEGFHRILIKGGQKNNVRTMLGIKHANHFQAADSRHLNIKEQNIRTQFMYRANGFHRIRTFADNLDVALPLQQDPQILPGYRFLIAN